MGYINTPRPRDRRCHGPFFPSTYVAVVLVALVLLLFDLPGAIVKRVERDGLPYPTGYEPMLLPNHAEDRWKVDVEHGWPWTYLRRGLNDAKILNQLWAERGTGSLFGTDPRLWAIREDVKEFAPLALVGDIFVSCVALACSAFLFERCAGGGAGFCSSISGSCSRA